MTEYEIHFSQNSEDDLEQITLFIAPNNIERAFSFIDEIAKFVKNQLLLFPYSGVKQDDGSYKLIFRKTVLIYYDVDENRKRVDILHIKRSYKPLEFFR